MKRHTSQEWLQFFGIDMMDPDGWRVHGQSHLGPEKLNMIEFMDRVNQSTIRFIIGEPFRTRRQMLDFISGLM